MDTDEKLRIAAQSSESIHKYVARFTVSMTDINSAEKYLSSGTLVAILDRVFVATACHCIPHNPNQRLWILPEHCRSMNDGMLAFKSVERHPNLDVAFLELDPQSVSSYLPHHGCCPLSSLKPLGCGRPNRIMTVCGSPTQFVEGDGSREEPAKVLNIGFSSTPFAPEAFPSVPSGERPADNEVDIFYEYPQQALRFEDNKDIRLESPSGFSGGGIWDQGFETRQVWSPDSALLFGVQSSWCPSQRYARGIQIIHWLRLVWERVEESRNALHDAFSGVDLSLRND